jgi:5-formyltetrahydrofolate cyclo-ligase
MAHFRGLPEYERAGTVMFYIDVRNEVRTRHDLPEALSSGKKIVVPYCVEGEQLELFHLTAMTELSEGAYGILEPREDMRGKPEKQVEARELDLIMVPGVAFDPRGGRAGHGKGYYDRLLDHAPHETPLVGVCYACQLFDEIPMQAHDVSMDRVVTEDGVYDGIGRGKA